MGGRLAQIFTLRAILAWTSFVISIGLLITASAGTLTVFIIGRAIAGCGAAGIYSTQTIVVLELASKKRRGLILGCVYAIVTVGLAGGAIIAGAITPVWGWVNMIQSMQLP